jgi:uncharacterized membrane protein YeaQ/YmgE (transglycosylase-associated protein family)
MPSGIVARPNPERNVPSSQASEGDSIVGIIAWIVLGAIAGFIANMLMGTREGLLMTIVLGIVGAVVGGFVAGTVLKLADVTGLNITSIVVAVFGAVIVIAVARAMSGRGRARL